MTSAPLRHPARLAGASLLRLQSDARLAELAAAGHEAAFDTIVDRYRAPLLKYCSGIVGPSRAEDAVQQALINAHEAMTRTDEVRHLRSWLYRIAHNASLNVLRAVRDDVPLDEASLGRRAADPTAAASPVESFERSEQFRATLAALQALPERQRAALVLRELEGRSHEEIADALGVTKGSARQHLMRARVAVRSAVTAITPYPLIARMAEMLSGAGGSAAGWVDAGVAGGASATLMKLGAGVAATGALVGGAVGTQHVVRGGSDRAAVPRAIADTSAGRGTDRVVQRTSAVAAVTPAALATSGAVGGTGASSSSGQRVRLHGGSTWRHKKPQISREPASLPITPSTPAASSSPVVGDSPSRRHPTREPSDGQRGEHGHSRRDQGSNRGHRRGSSDDDRSGHNRNDKSQTTSGKGQSKKNDNNGRDDKSPSTTPSSTTSGSSDKGKDDNQSATPTTTEPTSSGSKDHSSGDSSTASDPTTPTTTSPAITTPSTTTSTGG